MNRRFRERWALGVALVIGVVAGGCGVDTAAPPGGDDVDDVPYVGDPPAVYVAKVKNILVGLPPTEAELALVTEDRKALPGLIDGWMALPEYQQKMMVFFELAFQQTQISAVDFLDIVPPNGLGPGRAIPLLVQNARESFARTVLQLTAEGRPLTEAFTTRRLMMTPALMELYAFLDARQVNNAGKTDDALARAFPDRPVTVGTARGAIAFEETIDPESPKFMQWYSPDIAGLTYGGQPSCDKIDPITAKLSAAVVHGLLYGEIPNHLDAAGKNCGNRAGSQMSEIVTASDFTAWKMVTLRTPGAGEARTVFYDLPKLRRVNELVLSTPRIGFFSTPAFFANWPTNASNQMRVTANQALIVATGTAVDGRDTTSPDTTPGLDEAHAPTESGCFNCHRQLDPTRSILSATYSWFYYQQTDPALIRQPGLFAFQDVIAPIRTIDDFAQQLAQHPLVSQAWGQKLCYYANSSACDVLDPEFVRVLQAFEAGGGSWNVLVRELLASPLTTNAARTKTITDNGAVVAVSRRDHLCAAINNRLGLVDICQLDSTFRGRPVSTIATIVGGMPSDGYGRGSTVPVLPNQPTLFYRAGLENVCVQLATQVIDAAANPDQPGARRWSSAQPDVAIGELVGTVLAMQASDPRAAQATAILTSHFQGAVAAGTSPKDALRSTFVAACLSPSFIGIGM